MLLVALLAGGGFWWTLKEPDRTGNLAAADELSIPRGCHLDSTDLCQSSASPLTAIPMPAAPSQTVCRRGDSDGFVEVWRDDLGSLGLHWSLPSAANAVYPLSSSWVAVWAGAPGASGLLVSDARSGWALLPDSFAGRDLTAWAGSTGLGGELKEGLTSLEVVPFAATADGTVRLAAHVNMDAIVLEVPATDPFDLVRAREQLRFNEWTTGPLACAGA